MKQKLNPTIAQWNKEIAERDLENALNGEIKKLKQELSKLKEDNDKLNVAISIIKGIRDHGDNYDFSIMYDFLEEQGE